MLVRLGAELPAETADGLAAQREGGDEGLVRRARARENPGRWRTTTNCAGSTSAIRQEVLGLPWIPADLPIVEALLAAVRATGPRGVEAGLGR